MAATFDESSFQFKIDGAEVDALAAKGASDTLARDAQARMAVIIARLESGTISLQEGYDAAKRETKFLHLGEYALAHGGIDQVTDWSGAEAIIAEQWSGNEDFAGLRGLFEDIEKGRYGVNQLGRPVYGGGPSFQARLNAYSDAGRLTFENERLAARLEAGELLEAKAVTGASDHCPECMARAALGWIEAHRMYNDYPIGASRCGPNCYCVIVTRRAAIDEANAIGWHALPAAIGKVSKVAAPVAVGVLGLLQVARSNPALMRFLLELLVQALGGRKV
jgi:hypothetical protein